MPDPTKRPDCVVGARLCTPSVYAGPSGPRMRHDFTCPARPGQPISAKEYARGSQWPHVQEPRG